jgi:hypothetical protein
MDEKDTDIVPIQVKLTRGLRRRFKAKCKKDDIHYAQWIRRQIEKYVEGDNDGI